MILNAADNLEEIAGVGIAGRPEHAHETLRRLVRQRAKLLEPDCGVDIVTQYDLARIDITGKQAFDAFHQQLFSKCRVALSTRLYCFLEVTSKWHVLYGNYGVTIPQDYGLGR